MRELAADATQEARGIVEQSFKDVGFEDGPRPEIIDRLVVLEERSKFNHDSRLIQQASEAIVLELRSRGRLSEPVAEHDRGDIAVAALLHDIGKSGPANASREEQQAIVDLFAAERVKGGAQPVHEVLAAIEDAAMARRIEAAFRSLGLSLEMSMREFWDKHAYWTHDILEAYADDLPERVRFIAASHHIDRGIDPYGRGRDQVQPEALVIGAAEYYRDAMLGRVLMAVDKYEAIIRRSEVDHADAMERLQSFIGEPYRDDPMMQEIIRIIDELGSRGALFQ